MTSKLDGCPAGVGSFGSDGCASAASAEIPGPEDSEESDAKSPAKIHINRLLVRMASKNNAERDVDLECIGDYCVDRLAQGANNLFDNGFLPSRCWLDHQCCWSFFQ